PPPADTERAKSLRRRRRLLSLRLRRRPAQLQVAQHGADLEDPGADESRVAIRSDAHLDRERRRLEADGISDRVLLDDGMGSGSLTLRATRTLFGRLGSA